MVEIYSEVLNSTLFRHTLINFYSLWLLIEITSSHLPLRWGKPDLFQKFLLSIDSSWTDSFIPIPLYYDIHSRLET